MKNILTKTELTLVDTLYKQIAGHINTARSNIMLAIDTEQVKAYWLIGRDIVEEEQAGKERAGYGKEILKSLSDKLTAEFGKGFSVDTLERSRKFYLIYQKTNQDKKSATPLRKSEPPEFKTNLGWSHYLLLMKVSRKDSRTFYEIEASLNNWSVCCLSV